MITWVRIYQAMQIFRMLPSQIYRCLRSHHQCVVPCPPMNFVAECTTISAPYSIGRTRYGVANVLSTTSGILCSCAIFATVSISTTSEFGLPKCLNVKCFCIVLDCCFYFVNIKRIYKCSLNAVLRKCVLPAS